MRLLARICLALAWTFIGPGLASGSAALSPDPGPIAAGTNSASAPGEEATGADLALAPDVEPVQPAAIPGLNPALRHSRDLISNPNLLSAQATNAAVQIENLEAQLEEARLLKRSGHTAKAEKVFLRLLQTNAPPVIQQTALLELAVLAHENRQFLRAQQIYARFLKLYPDDAGAPEVLLRQGLIYREMGAPVMALSKFYAVMSTALNLKLERLEYYQRLVLQAQTEIADTYYLQGKHEEAVDFLSRLLKLDNPALDRSRILFKLVRSLSFCRRYEQVVARAGEYLELCPDSSGSAEVRFLLAGALKKLSRNSEALEQVLTLLQSQRRNAKESPENWLYWQQRTGNEIGNQLYQEGDYVNALEVYRHLAALNTAPTWQLLVQYQIGLVYERLQQPQKALETYGLILSRQPELGTNAVNPSLTLVLDMARWRQQQLSWRQLARQANRQFSPAHQPAMLSP